MPSNRRKTPARRPRVAGLRHRETLLGDALQEEAREARRAAGEQRASGGAAGRASDVEASRNGSVEAERGEAEVERSDVAGVAAGSVQLGEAVDPERSEAVDSEPAAERGEEAGVEPEGSGGVAAPSAKPKRAAAAKPGESAGAEPARSSGVAAPSAPYEAQRGWTAGAQPGVVAGAAASGGTSLKGVTWAVWILAILFAGAAVFLGIQAFGARYSGAGANEALVSAGATSEVNGQISDAVEKVFSYDFNDTAKTETAARDLLVGSAVQKYDDLFKVVREQAPQQQLIVTTTVKSSAVTRLQGDRAELLLFVDQHAMRANTGESNVGPAQISVSAEKQGDRWKITQITLR
ncbi:hypothetical protein AB0I53_26630 [Saccharopolyspora sp. NPDC050389]|uniref:hypothetical protein n=1 Tax=Saccharopolyspora sp. NPDC050389 TaxID=3155516 RepID=UPI0033C51876